jgi:hypothetical protein
MDTLTRCYRYALLPAPAQVAAADDVGEGTGKVESTNEEGRKGQRQKRELFAILINYDKNSK